MGCALRLPLRRAASARALLGVVALGFALGVAGCPGKDAASASKDPGAPKRAEVPILVEAGPVTTRTLSAIYATSTTLRAEKQATVTARTQGVIERFAVEEGDAVVEGDALAHLEASEQRIELERASALIAEKRRGLTRAESLHARGAMSDNDLETARREHDDASHRLALAQLELDRTTIRAVFSGRVLRRHLDPGAMVQNGTAVLDLADLDPLFADVNVPERHVARLGPGQDVRLRTEARADPVAARIARVAPGVDAASGTVRVTVAVSGEHGHLRPGSFVRVEVVTERRAGALVVPRSALVADGRRWRVFRVAADGQSVDEVQVALGFQEGDLVEVLPPGGVEDPKKPFLRIDERVVTGGASALSAGSAIELAPAEGGSAEGGSAEAGSAEAASAEAGRAGARAGESPPDAA